LKNLSLIQSLIPIAFLIVLLTYNVYVFGDDSLEGSNQFILLIGASVAVFIGFINKINFQLIIKKIGKNLYSVTGAILILLFVGALTGTWLISGIIPAMIYYGLLIINPSIFLPACVILCAVVSLATGSSWSTSATIGVALIGIGKALGLPAGIVAGAAISGAYFGDKLSPLSDTTNLAPAVSGAKLFQHIKYMTYTTVPSILITIIILLIIGFSQDLNGNTETISLLSSIEEKFNVSPLVFIAPAIVIYMIIRKAPPLIALFAGTLLGGLFSLMFQSKIIIELSGVNQLTFYSAYQTIINAVTIETQIVTSNELLNDLFYSGGMKGMMNTIWLIICAMVFGGAMDAIGALKTISERFLAWANSTFKLFASTLASCLTVNLTASDQYLSIVIPGKMFAKAYKKRKLAPENLSRTLEDSGTVTSVLIPWNTCGAYQSGVLGVSVADYFIYSIFNWISPFMTLFYAAFKIKIKMISSRLNNSK
jgi:NhaC family Na+:H+ antiporter|tara:strand:- start:1179 stop:2621 length:1443 start_codon:yes stop_codon:yes gene_type:complete